MPLQGELGEALHATIAVALERARLAEAAEEARLILETERTRTDLLSAVSHDLRTPLAAITGAITAVLDRPDARPEPLLYTVRDESERLGRLISGLLDLTRLEANPAPEMEWVPIDEVVASAIDRVKLQLRPAEIRTVLPRAVVMVPMAPVLVDQLLFNLIDNAVKYAPDGPIDVIASHEGGIRVEVHDRGRGLPREGGAHLFERFWRAADGGRTDSAGLGLAIAAAIARVHGGTVFARPRDGGGAVFGFTLPIHGEPPTLPEEPE